MAIYDVTTPTSSAAVSGTATVFRVSDRTAASTANAVSSATREKVVAADASSAAIVTSNITAQRLIDKTAASVGVVTGSASAGTTLGVVAPSSAIVYGTARYDGEEMDAWSTNLINQAVGKYTGFNFNSFANVGGRLFGFNDDGVYEITGTTDAGAAIPFFLMSESTSKLGGDMGLGMLLPHTAYVVGNLPESPSNVDLFMVTDNDEVYSYPVGATETRMSTARVLVGKGLRVRYLRYGLVGVAADTVEVASITVKANSSVRNI